MPRQGVWQNLRARRQSRHLVSSRLVSLPSTFHLVVATFGMQETGRLCSQWGSISGRCWVQEASGLRGKSQTWYFKIFLIWTSKSYKVEPLTWSAPGALPQLDISVTQWGIWLFLVPCGGATSTHTKRDLRRWVWARITWSFPLKSWWNHSPICQALVRRTAGPEQRKGPLQSDVRGGFELSISYSFVYFTCSLTV